MKKILFVCHGNICRSVTAEFVFKHLTRINNLESKYYVESRATTREEIGNDIYPPMKRTLINNGINVLRHYATQITQQDYEIYDLILLMDEENMYGIKRIIPKDYLKKIFLLTEYVDVTGDIEDPWYSGRYEFVYNKIKECLERLMEKLENEN
ncbi:MAG: low molecular weight phosphotyrosine protein phosphatase [Erysipelotrichales bacterium]|nr:low molecular weight phosphotyrosine protein phosphatase [Erysipelotrichales bacterium]